VFEPLELAEVELEVASALAGVLAERLDWLVDALEEVADSVVFCALEAAFPLVELERLVDCAAGVAAREEGINAELEVGALAEVLPEVEAATDEVAVELWI
jgi:hypothetical protein